MRPARITVLILVAWVGALLLSHPAVAHHKNGEPHTGGIAIPSISHGQMQTVARYRSAIADLADEQPFTDPTFRTLQSFVALQHALCFWTIVPGSISDEASPFNECAHADLAAARALLDHMLEMPFAHEKAAALLSKIQRDIRTDPASWSICRFGEEPFYSNSFIFPHLGAVLLHPPTLLTALVTSLLPILCIVVVRSSRRHRQPTRHSLACGESELP